MYKITLKNYIKRYHYDSKYPIQLATQHFDTEYSLPNVIE